MAEVIYKGDHREVVVPITPTRSVTAVWGVPVEVPDEVAVSLLTSGAWMKASKKAGKKTAEEAVANNDKKELTDGSR